MAVAAGDLPSSVSSCGCGFGSCNFGQTSQTAAGQEVFWQSYKRDMELLGWVQCGVTKVIEELEHL